MNTRGRPKEYDPELVLDAAMFLFWRQGFKATSLPDLLSATGLSKSSFYQAFGSKDALFETCIERYRDRLMVELGTKQRSAPSALGFITGSLLAVADEAARSETRIGCLLMNTATELAQSDPKIAALVAESIEASTRVFERAVRRAQKAGEIGAKLEPRVLATFVVSSMGGMRTMVKAGASEETIRRVAEVTISAL